MRLLGVLASFAAVTGLAVPAHADPSGDDAAFLAALKQAGITYQDPDRRYQYRGQGGRENLRPKKS